MNDERIKPFVQHLYGSAIEAAQIVEQNLGMTVEQILAIPEGEITLAFAAPPAFGPAPVLIFDLPKDRKNLEALMDQGVDAIKRGGYSRETETIEGTEVDIFEKGIDGDGPGQILRFIRDDTLVITPNKRIATRILELWSGKEEDTILENQAFKLISARCKMGEEEQPQWFWFADPIGIAKAATRGNLGAAAGLAILPAIGLDGFKGVGGSTFLPDSEFEAVSHMHIYLEPPRDGVLEMITLKEGDSEPQDWVPSDVINYINVHLDLQETYTLLKELVDSFRGEGTVGGFVKSRMSEELGVDVEQDIIAQLEGRMTMVQLYEKPARINSQSTMLAARVRSRERFEKTFKTLMEDRFGDNLEAANFEGHTIYRVAFDDDPIDEENERRARRQRFRRNTRPHPSFILLDDYFIFADRPSSIERLIRTKKDPEISLKASIDFQLMLEKIHQQPNGKTASMVTFSRPAEALKMFYELMRSDDAKKFLADQRDENPFFRALDDALQENPLPPFSELEKYFTTAAGLMTNEESGIHSVSFSLRLDEAE